MTKKNTNGANVLLGLLGGAAMVGIGVAAAKNPEFTLALADSMVGDPERDTRRNFTLQRIRRIQCTHLLSEPN